MPLAISSLLFPRHELYISGPRVSTQPTQSRTTQPGTFPRVTQRGVSFSSFPWMNLGGQKPRVAGTVLWIQPTPKKTLETEEDRFSEAITQCVDSAMHEIKLSLNYVSQKKSLSSESHLVMFSCLWPHGLYSPWNSLGQNIGVGRLSLLQGIFQTQVSRVAGGFFTSWATKEAQEYWSG